MRSTAAVVVITVLLVGCAPQAPEPESSLPPVAESINPGDVQLGEGATIPLDWPPDVPLPDGDDLVLQSALRTELSEGIVFTAIYVSDRDPQPVVGDLEERLAADGFRRESEWKRRRTTVGISTEPVPEGTRLTLEVLVQAS